MSDKEADALLDVEGHLRQAMKALGRAWGVPEMREQFIITAGSHVHLPVGPFPSYKAAEAEYRRNQPRGQVYLEPPTIVRLLRPLQMEPDYGR